MRTIEKKYDAPHLQRIYEKGIQDGAILAKDNLNAYLLERIESLGEVPGIGGKTYEKVIEHFKAGMKK